MSVPLRFWLQREGDFMTRIIGVAILGITVALLAGCSHQKHEEGTKISASEVPAAVMNTAKTRLPGAEVSSVEKENGKGGVVYDLEFKQGGRKYEMDIKEDGTLMEIEKQVMASDIPAAVMTNVKAKYPNATVKEIMEVNKVSGKQEAPIHYEVTVMDGGKERELVVSLDGTKVQSEAEAEKEEKK